MVDQVLPSPDHIAVVTSPRQASASCPDCGVASERLHGRHRRPLSDLPWQGRPVTLHVHARRFRCLNPTCFRQAFAERLSGTAPAAARRTGRLGDLQGHLGLALGGEAGARLAERLAMPTSADTLLRLVCKVGSGPEPPPTPRVLAVDDWAERPKVPCAKRMEWLRRGGAAAVATARSLLIWSATRWSTSCPTAKPTRWPGGRAGTQASRPSRATAPKREAFAAGPAPMRTACGRVRRMRSRLQVAGPCCATSATRSAAWLTASAPLSGVRPGRPANKEPPCPRQHPSPSRTVPNRVRQPSAARHPVPGGTRATRKPHGRAAGASISRIAAELGADRKTVRSWLRAGGAPLWRELVGLGFPGRPGTVRSWAGQRRRSEPQTAGGRAGTRAADEQTPSSRQVARLLMADPDALPEAEQGFVSCLLAQVPGLAEGIAVAKRLNTLLRHESEEKLGGVLDAAVGTPLEEFAASLRRDLAAVQAALDLPWTTSPAEGQTNRLKMLKRTMYGRAGFPPLRARVLHAA